MTHLPPPRRAGAPITRLPATAGAALLALLAAVDAGEGVFVAVGYGGRRMRSRDGLTWEHVQQWSDKAADDSNNLIAIAYGKDRFVAVGGGGFGEQAGHILVSADGATWREVHRATFRIHPVLYTGERFVAGAPGHRLLCSDDGETWTDGAVIPVPPTLPGWAFWFRAAACGPGAAVFAGNAGSKETATWWSATAAPDGSAISASRFDLPAITGLAHGAGRFAMTAADGLRIAADGRTWQHRAAQPAADLTGVVWDGARFVVSAKSGTFVSADAAAWTRHSGPAPGRILHAGPAGWIASAWPGRMFRSADGIAWQAAPAVAPALGINAVAWGVPVSP